MDLDAVIHQAKLDYMLGLHGFLFDMPLSCEHGQSIERRCKKCEAEEADETPS